jgi:TRAP-type uncharacterized transport system fused permease subunit
VIEIIISIVTITVIIGIVTVSIINKNFSDVSDQKLTDDSSVYTAHIATGTSNRAYSTIKLVPDREREGE